MDYELFELKGGLRAVYKAAPAGNAVSHFCVLVQAGSGDEGIDEWGLAHFTEHMLFKGTRNRSTSRILNRLELTGGDLNAFTTREYTCLHASFLTQHTQRAIELLADMLLNSTFREDEIEKEKGVIMDEIESCLDIPEESIQDDFDENLFPGHPLFRNILGNKASVASFSRPSFLAWVERLFHAGRIIIGLSSSIGSDRFLKLAEKHFDFSGENRANSVQPDQSPVKPFAQPYQPFSLRTPKPINQVHGMLGMPACNIYDERRPAMLVLNNLLGGPGMSSRLNMEIREKRGICYTIESSYAGLRETGVFSIYFGTERAKAKRCMALIRKELDRLMQSPLSPLALAQARQRFKGQIALAEEARSSVLVSICKSILDFGHADSLEELYAKLDLVTASAIQTLAAELFEPSGVSSLILEPEE